MIENFNVFRSFSTLAQAQELEALLNENNISTVLGDNIAPVNVTSLEVHYSINMK